MARGGKSRSNWGWYAAKTAYRTLGRWYADASGRAFPGRVSMVEERIVLFRARSWGEAYDRALAEARRYAARPAPSDGQPRWRTKRVIDACIVFVLPGVPEAGSEVFIWSNYEKREVPMDEILRQKFDGHRIACVSRLEVGTGNETDG